MADSLYNSALLLMKSGSSDSQWMCGVIHIYQLLNHVLHNWQFLQENTNGSVVVD